MTEGKQTQKGGDHSQQVQIYGDYVVQEGITEERAQEIARNVAIEVVESFSAEAIPVGQARIESFDTALVAHLGERDLLDAFKDPAFHALLRKAQLSAASTEREGDHELLARLLGERAASDDRRRRASVDRAVQIIDLLDEAALEALTATWALVTLRPASGRIAQGLDALESALAPILAPDLPAEEDEWLDHLEVLGAIRLLPANLSSPLGLDQILAKGCDGYAVTGFAPERADEVLAAVAPAPLAVVDHELREGYCRLEVPGTSQLEDLLTERTALTPDQVATSVAAARDVGTVGSEHADAFRALGDAIDERPTLRRLREWRGRGARAFEITGVGKAVAIANAWRRDADQRLPRDLLT